MKLGKRGKHATAERGRTIDAPRQPDGSRRGRLLLGLDEAFFLQASQRDVDRPALEPASRRLDQLKPELRALFDEQLEDQSFLRWQAGNR